MQKMGWFGVAREHSRSWAMPPFDRAHTTSYSTLIETMSFLYRFRDIAGYLSKVVDFDPPAAFDSLVGWTPVEFRGDLWRQKTRLLGLSRGIIYAILRLPF